MAYVVATYARSTEEANGVPPRGERMRPAPAVPAGAARLTS